MGGGLLSFSSIRVRERAGALESLTSTLIVVKRSEVTSSIHWSGSCVLDRLFIAARRRPPPPLAKTLFGDKSMMLTFYII